MRIPTFFFEANDKLKTMVDRQGIFEWLVKKIQEAHPTWDREQAVSWILDAKAREEPAFTFGAPAFGHRSWYKTDYTLRDHFTKAGILDEVLKGPRLDAVA